MSGNKEKDNIPMGKAITIIVAVIVVVVGSIGGAFYIMINGNISIPSFSFGNDKEIVGIWNDYGTEIPELAGGFTSGYVFEKDGTCIRRIALKIGYQTMSLEYVGKYTARDNKLTVEWQSLTTTSEGYVLEKSDGNYKKETESIDEAPKIYTYLIRGDIITISDGDDGMENEYYKYR